MQQWLRGYAKHYETVDWYAISTTIQNVQIPNFSTHKRRLQEANVENKEDGFCTRLGEE